ncbi:hypothetical protein Salat_2728100 [Sesamum alatum]|uniref:DUF4408 domain-containing protein n=1 Tax=Sesamum alatum TaxID=300844 RepID=A0AAE1XJV1_9LAMI|nr:hypothetical protein Salat_2728100 [Sesamum alatum]
MRNYKRAKFLYDFVLYSLASLITCLFVSYSSWFPFLKYSLSSLSNDISFLLNAKCLFVVGNLIIFILIGESKLKQPSRSSPASDVYDEYVARSRSSHRKVIKFGETDGSMQTLKIEEKKHGNVEERICNEEEKREIRVCKSSMHHEEKKKGMRVCKSEGEINVIKKGKTKGKKEEEKELYMPQDELNKRVEAFIARVNKQRLLEANLVDHIQNRG